MAKKPRKPSIVFLTPAQLKAREKARAFQRAWGAPWPPKNAAWITSPISGAGTQPLPIRTSPTGLVTDPRLGGIPAQVRASKPVKPPPISHNAKARPPAGKGAGGTAGTVPPQAKTPPGRKPTSLAHPSQTQQAKRQAQAKQTPRRAAAPVGQVVPQVSQSALIRQMVDASLAPYYQQINSEQARQESANQEQIRRTQGFTQALLAQLQGIPGAVQGDFDRARASDLSLAQINAEQFRQGSPGAQIQSDLGAVGAPAEQQAQIQAQTQAQFGGGAAAQFGMFGDATARQLSGSGAAQTAYAHMLPAIAAAQAQDVLRGQTYQQGLERQKLADQRAQIAARAPELYFQAQGQLSDLAVKQRAQQWNEDYLRWQMGQKAQNQQFQQGATLERLSQGRVGLGLRSQQMTMQQLSADRQWQATLQRLGISEKSLKLQALKAQHDWQSGGLTPGQKRSLQEDAFSIARSFYNGLPAGANDPLGLKGGYGYEDDSSGSGTPDIVLGSYAEHQNGYQIAMKEMLGRGIPLVVAQRALNSFWRTPGKYGRPRIPFQQRKPRR